MIEYRLNKAGVVRAMAAVAVGRRHEPGGWNRIVLRVDDLNSIVETMKKGELHFRNEIESGPGGKQIQVEDRDGNPIELFEPAH